MSSWNAYAAAEPVEGIKSDTDVLHSASQGSMLTGTKGPVSMTSHIRVISFYTIRSYTADIEPLVRDFGIACKIPDCFTCCFSLSLPSF